MLINVAGLIQNLIGREDRKLGSRGNSCGESIPCWNCLSCCKRSNIVTGYTASSGNSGLRGNGLDWRMRASVRRGCNHISRCWTELVLQLPTYFPGVLGHGIPDTDCDERS